jgi:hypothetical protein
MEEAVYITEMFIAFLFAGIFSSVEEYLQCETCIRSVLYVRFNSAVFDSNVSAICPDLFVDSFEEIWCTWMTSIFSPDILDQLEAGATAMAICVNRSKCPVRPRRVIREHFKSPTKFREFLVRHFDLGRLVTVGDLIVERTKDVYTYVSLEYVRAWNSTWKAKAEWQERLRSVIKNVTKK